MTPELLDLARQLAAWPRFRWVPGMLNDDGDRYLGDGLWTSKDGDDRPFKGVRKSAAPDLTDPLTVLGLLVLVREVYGDPEATCAPDYEINPNKWLVRTVARDECGRVEYVEHRSAGATEVEALARALLGAP